MSETAETPLPPVLAGPAVRWIVAGPTPDDQLPPADMPEPAIAAGWAERPVLAHLRDLAARQPELMAIDDGERTLSFAGLYATACAVGAAIRGAGWADGAVGVLLPNEARYPAVGFGVLAAGRPCMMLAPHQPAEYLRRIVVAAGLVGVVTCAALASRLDPALPALDIDAVPPEGAAVPPLLLDPAAPAFIVSTSGSSGAPKAVAQSQRNSLANYLSRIRMVRVGPHDRVAITGAPATSGAQAHRMYALMAGAGLVVVDVQGRGLGAALDRLAATRATILHATPALLKALVGLPAAPAALASLRMVLVNGDAMLRADLAVIRRALPAGCRVLYALSLSESARVSHWFVPPDDAHDPVRVAVGYLCEGVGIMLLDEDGGPAAPGEPGELVVRSGVTALGDWADGGLLPDRFPRDPDDPARRIVRTGDVVRLCPDGVLVMLGRRDRMVKIGGQRVEPATIEMALRSCPGIADAAVVPLRGPDTVRLAAFVVPAADAPTAGDPDGKALLRDLRSTLRATLPGHMVPALLRRIDALPITAAGKRDDRALIALAEAP